VVLHERVSRLRPALWPILQTSVAAALAWELALLLPGHDRPLFAPIVALVAMGISAGRRGKQAVLLVLGVMVGIAVADLLSTVLDTGAWQLALVVFVSMALGLLLSREGIFVTQAGLSALLAFAVERQSQGLAPARLIDALIGAGIALLIAVVLFPIDPLKTLARAARPLFEELRRMLVDTAAALREGRPELAERARGRRLELPGLDEAVSLGLQAVRIAPRRVRDRGRVQAYAEAASRLAPVSRVARVLAGSAARAVRSGGGPAPELAPPVEALAASLAALERWLEQDDRAARDEARALAAEAIRLAGAMPPPAESGAATIVHLVEVAAGHVLRATGLEERER
jgi:uncharacterized membrane protein YgaE (UPF0421/DUF939 family)